MVAPLVSAAARLVTNRVFIKAAGDAEGSFTGERPSRSLYMLVGMIALLKDVLDAAFNLMNAIPGLGMVLSFIFGICLGTTIFLLLATFDRSSGMKSLWLVKRLLITIMTLLADMLPIFSFLPLTTLSVALMYLLALSAWKQQSKAASRNPSPQAAYA